MKLLSIFALFFIAFFFSVSSFGQKVRFTDTSNVWKIFVEQCGIPPYDWWYSYFFYKGDTMLSGTRYQKLPALACSAPLDYLYIREDTLLNKVFIKAYCIEGFAVDTNEMVLYDYNWQVGDTIHRNYPGFQSKHYVHKIDSTLINSVYHKTWHVQPVAGFPHSSLPVSYVIIEGIGTNRMPCYSALPFLFEGCFRLICFHNNGQSPPLNPAIGPFNNTTSCNTVNVEESILQAPICVAPNPATIHTRLLLPQPMNHANLVVYNMMGLPVYNTELNGQDNIPVGRYISVPGQYFYRLVDHERNQAYTGKFIFQ